MDFTSIWLYLLITIKGTDDRLHLELLTKWQFTIGQWMDSIWRYLCVAAYVVSTDQIWKTSSHTLRRDMVFPLCAFVCASENKYAWVLAIQQCIGPILGKLIFSAAFPQLVPRLFNHSNRLNNDFNQKTDMWNVSRQKSHVYTYYVWGPPFNTLLSELTDRTLGGSRRLPFTKIQYCSMMFPYRFISSSLLGK